MVNPSSTLILSSREASLAREGMVPVSAAGAFRGVEQIPPAFQAGAFTSRSESQPVFRGFSQSLSRSSSIPAVQEPIRAMASRSASESVGAMMRGVSQAPRRGFRTSISKSVGTSRRKNGSASQSRGRDHTSRSKKRRRSASARRSRSVLRGDDADDCLVVVLCENKAREVGLACIDIRRVGTLRTWQFADSQNYVQTLGLLDVLQPAEIVLPATAEGSLLFSKVQQAWGKYNPPPVSHNMVPMLDPTYLRYGTSELLFAAVESEDVSLRTIQRSVFNADEGSKRLGTLSSRPSQTSSETKGKHLALAACNAVVRYVESVQKIFFESECLHVVVESGQARMVIDWQTLHALEIFQNLNTASKTDSLYDICNFCQTKQGQRFLRAQLMAPPTSAGTIEARQNAIEELMSVPELGHSLRQKLEALSAFDIDRLVSHLSHRPATTTIQTCAASIRDLLQLKELLKCIVRFSESHDSFSSPLLIAVHDSLGTSKVQATVTTIEEYLNPDTEWKKNLFDRQLEELFAVRTGIDGSLDAMRQLFMQNLEEVYEMPGRCQTTWNAPGVKLLHKKSKGHYLQVPAQQVSAGLPEGAIDCERLKDGRINCTTIELATLNRKLQHNIECIYQCTDEVVCRLRADIRQSVGVLCVAAEAIGLLDFVFSLSCMPLSDSMSSVYCKPMFIDREQSPSPEGGLESMDRELDSEEPAETAQPESGAATGALPEHEQQVGTIAASSSVLELKDARHPCVQRASEDDFVPNDYSSDATGCCVTVVRGANGTGKSTYLKTIAINVILAQIGAFCPCRAFKLSAVKRIASKLGDADDIAEGVSSFFSEMMQTAYLLQHAGPSCLVIIDELGRSTSHADATGMSVAVLEQLARRRCHTIFASHNDQVVGRMDASSQSQVATVHMSVASSEGNVRCLFKAAPAVEGVELDPEYGIRAARRAGLPPQLIADAKRMRAILDGRNPGPLELGSAPSILGKGRSVAGNFELNSATPAGPVGPVAGAAHAGTYQSNGKAMDVELELESADQNSSAMDAGTHSTNSTVGQEAGNSSGIAGRHELSPAKARGPETGPTGRENKKVRNLSQIHRLSGMESPLPSVPPGWGTRASLVTTGSGTAAEAVGLTITAGPAAASTTSSVSASVTAADGDFMGF